MKMKHLATAGSAAVMIAASMLGGASMASAAPIQDAPLTSAALSSAARAFTVNEQDGSTKYDAGYGLGWWGNGTPGSSVQVVDGSGRIIATTTVTKFGSWFATTKSTLPNGELSVTFRSTDAQGETTEVPMTFTVHHVTDEDLAE